MSRPEIRTAMSYLAQKARSHTARTCGGGVVTSPDEPAPTLPGVSGVVLKVTSTIQDRVSYNVLNWSGASGTSVIVHRNATLSRTIENDGRWRNHPKSSGQYTYWICETGTSRCSNKVAISFP